MWFMKIGQELDKWLTGLRSMKSIILALITIALIVIFLTLAKEVFDAIVSFIIG